MRITRRHLLALTAAGAAVATVGTGAAVFSWWNRPAGSGYRVLATEEAAFLRSMADAAFPATSRIVTPGGQMSLDHFFDEVLQRLEPVAARELRALIALLDGWPVPSHGGRYRNLPIAVRQQVLADLLDHGVLEVRSAATGLLILLSDGFALHPQVVPLFSEWHRCGYGP